MKLRHKNKRGGAAIEAAICLPWILLLMGATIELSTSIFLKETLTIAAFEGARVGAQRKATNQMVRDRVMQVLNERGVTLGGADPTEKIIITPDVATADMLEPITITVLAPADNNIITPIPVIRFVTQSEFGADVVMRKEFTLAN